ncbi:DUF4910 domain-containing protein [Candidatus Bathyarchaeota archaeon]|nr:DUF4910 domain-containing protein [Candidatus Bathyarchaeota archaeon]
MFKKIYDALENEISGEIAYNYVDEISRDHRIQASPGLRSAVNYAVDTLRKNGLEAEVQSYTANGKDFVWSSLMFKEWSCDNATLKLVEPEENSQFLARWDESKLSLIQRSYPTPQGGLEAEVVHVGKGEENEDYENIDVKGKMVLCNGDVSRVHELAVEQRGALGLIYYGTWIRPPVLPEGELDDALKYTSFWWSGEENPGLGFVLTPRKGRWLRDLLEEKPVKVQAHIDSEIYEGTLDNAVATIQGVTDEEVVIIAHICHPQPSCNDNASGSAAAMEAARALQKLIDQGVLEKPKKTIRITLVPEMSGSYTHLAANEEKIDKMLAAINLDMVGEKQSETASSFILERTPEATPSYVNSLLETIFEETQMDVENLGGSGKYALFRHTVTPFSGGSDHYIYSDPTVKVPCPMIIQWPDKYWHTSFDTMDKVDPEMLKKAALLTATYAYTIANADETTALWIASQTYSKEKQLVTERLQREINEAANNPDSIPSKEETLVKRTNYWIDQSSKAIESVKTLIHNSEKLDKEINSMVKDLESTIKDQLEIGQKIMKKVMKASAVKPKTHEIPDKELMKDATEMVPERIYRGPVSTRYWERQMKEEDREGFRKLGKDYENCRTFGTLALYWTDGNRNLKEINELVELETGKTNLEYLMKYFRYLEKMNLIKIHDR